MLKRLFLITILVLLTLPTFAQETVSFPRPTMGDFDEASLIAIDLEALPIIPEVTETARAIYAMGQAMGNEPTRFSKIGDCMTASEEFLTPFGDEYDLGDYGDLEAVIDYFSTPVGEEADSPNSYTRIGLGTASGFNTATLTDALFSDPAFCDPNESSLACEYRVTKSAFALIMLGTNDILYFDAPDFDFALRNIVLDTIDAGIVPVLYTFPIRPEFPEKTDTFNKIIASIAADYDLPLVNLWLAIKDLPDSGVDAADPIHLSEPADGITGIFDEERLQFGYPMRNLITLQTLDVLVAGLGERSQ